MANFEVARIVPYCSMQITARAFSIFFLGMNSFLVSRLDTVVHVLNFRVTKTHSSQAMAPELKAGTEP